jgi:uncharacterized Tic20 family protein
MEQTSALPMATPTKDERLIATLAHLSAFVAALICPLVIYLIKKDESAFVADQAKEALNFHISMLIYAIVAGLSVLIVIGVVLLPALGVFFLVVTIIGAIRAYEGTAYRYPLCIRFIS